MANKGGSNKNKRMSLPNARHVLRKTFTWAIRPMPGPHNKKTVVPLGELLRDKLQLSANRRETRAILGAGKIWVDEVPRKETQFPVGLFDIVRIQDEQKAFRVVFDTKGRLQLREIPFAEKPVKVCRIVHKTVLAKDKIQLTAHDGRTFLEKTSKTNVGDSVVVELPSQKIVATLALEKGYLGYVMSGTHVGTMGKISGSTQGTMQKKALVELQTDAESFQTLRKNIAVIGEKKPAISVDLPEKNGQ